MLKVWFGNELPDPAQDLADFAAGTTLMVSCRSRPHDEPSARFKLGTLHLTVGEPVTWERPREQAVALRPPLSLADSADKAGQPLLTAFTLTSASGSFSVQIPTLDVELVKHALAVQAA